MTRSILLSIALCVVLSGTSATAADTRPAGGGFAGLLAELEPGGRYGHLPETSRRDAREALLRMQRRIDAAGGADRLSKKARIAVFNDQELVNGILTGADPKDRLVCRHERRTGSHLEQGACLTVAERQQATEHARDAFRDMPPQGGNP